MVTKTLQFTVPFPLLAYPFYLWSRSPGKTGSHFDPSSDLFVPSEGKDVITSTVCWTAMAALLVGLGFAMGPMQLLKLYGVPYWVFIMWLDLVTYLHHHGHEEKLPWYRGKLCSLVSLQRYTKALSTLQRASLVEKSRQKPQERMKVLCEGACVTFPHLLCNFPPNRKERFLAICHWGGWYRGFGFRIQSKSIISII